MSNDRKNGSLLDILFYLRSGQVIVLKEVGIKVFDALRMMKPEQFDKNFIWGSDKGVAVQDITGWEVISQYDE